MSKLFLLPAALLLLVACSAGSASRAGGRQSPHAALADLMVYRGEGAPAARRTIEWVDRIVAGGSAMIPALNKALQNVPNRKYSGTWQAGFREGIASSFPSLRAALIEAVSRIGGDKAVSILRREATRPGRWQDAWIDRFVALLYLVPHADRADVRHFFSERLLSFLELKRSGSEFDDFLRVVRGHVESGVYGPLARAFQAGWAKRDVDDQMVELLVSLDRARTGKLLLKVLGDGGASAEARACAARSLGRFPGFREGGLREILELNRPVFAGWYLRGLITAPLGEVDRDRAARESMDLGRMRRDVKSLLLDQSRRKAILEELSSKLDAKVAKVLKMGHWREELGKRVELTEARRRDLLGEVVK